MDILISTESSGHRTKAYLLVRAMKESGIKEECSECAIGIIWNNKSLKLQVDHINGNRFDNRIENLRFLCPNCHTQTETYGAKNRKA